MQSKGPKIRLEEEEEEEMGRGRLRGGEAQMAGKSREGGRNRGETDRPEEEVGMKAGKVERNKQEREDV